MTDDQVALVQEFLKTKLQTPENYKVDRFTGYRHPPDGSTQRLTVEILDRGSGIVGARYQVHATTPEGHFAGGNGADDLRTALAIVHWDDLDKPPRKF